jgi:hypothetical protein
MFKKGRILKEITRLQTNDKTEFEDRSEINSKLIDKYYIPRQGNIIAKKSFVFKWKFIASLSAAVVILILSMTMYTPINTEIYHNADITNMDISINDLQAKTDTITIKETLENGNFNITNQYLAYVTKTNETAYFKLNYTYGDLTAEVIVIEKLEYKENLLVLKTLTNKIIYKNYNLNYLETVSKRIIISYETENYLIYVNYPVNDISAAENFIIEVIE